MTDSSRLSQSLAGRYTVERELGSGGMATVYLARDVKHDRQVALKVLREELSASLGKERFLREIKVAAGLQHPHILPLYDSGEADGLLFYVMPFGRRAEAIREMTRARSDTTLVWGTGGKLELAQGCVLVGDYACAIDMLRALTAGDSPDLTPALLKLDPIWDPLRGRADFKKLVGEK